MATASITASGAITGELPRGSAAPLIITPVSTTGGSEPHVPGRRRAIPEPRLVREQFLRSGERPTHARSVVTLFRPCPPPLRIENGGSFRRGVCATSSGPRREQRTARPTTPSRSPWEVDDENQQQPRAGRPLTIRR